MPDNIERTIYKLEIDDSGYIRGVESMSASTKKLVEVQNETNKQLQTNQAALKANSDFIIKAKKDLDAYTGSNEAYRKQLEKQVTDAQASTAKLTTSVNESRKAYEAATKAAQDFAATSSRASNLQPSPGARVNPPVIPPIPSNLFADLTGLDNIVANTKEEFDELRAAIILAEAALEGFDPGTEEFNTLSEVIGKGKQALLDYENASKLAGGGTKSYRSELAAANLELKRLQESGTATTQQILEQQKVVVRLTDAYEKQQLTIKTLASNTRALDFGKDAIQAAISSFQAYTAVSILAGGASEDLQKKTIQLFAAMQLLASLEQLATVARRLSINVTDALSKAQGLYTTVIGASTGALRVFKSVLLTTGIGAVLVGIGLLVNKFIQVRNAIDEAGKQQKLFNEITNAAIKNYSTEVTHLDLIKTKLNDISIPQKQRVEIAKEYNKTAEEGNKIDLQQIDNIALVNKAIDSQIEKLKERGLARAAESIIAQKAEALLLSQEKSRLKNIQSSIDATKEIPEAAATQFQNVGGKLIPFTLSDAQKQAQEAAAQGRFLASTIEKDPDVIAAKKELQDALSVGAKFITPESLVSGVTTVDTKKVEDAFAAKLKELQSRLADVTAKSFESEQTIRDQFAASLDKELEGIKDKFGKDLRASGVPGKTRFEVLVELAARINDVQLQESLNNFNKKILDARKKIEDDLNALQSKVALDSINLIQDEFDRRAAIIDFNEKKELAEAKKANEDRLASLELNKLLIGEQAYQDAKAEIISTGERNALNIIARAARERQKLSQDAFDKLLENLGNSLNERDVEAAEQLAAQIQNERDKLNAGLINQQQFEDNVTAITKAAIDFRTGLRRAELQLQLDAVNVALEASDDDEAIERLKKRQLELRDAIATIDTDTAKGTSGGGSTKKVETVQDYVVAIASLTDSIVSFWQKANEAEAAALDRSIALQERRVEAAQRIAERGNASYLKAETDRLKELQVARENAARRELAINAALQASQLLVGITGAITKIATPGVGTADVIASIAVIFAALATGYGLVKSLQGNQPQFKEGTKSVKRAGQPAGVDTIQAWVSEGEAIIPARTNKEYHPAVSAIYDKKIPAEVLNNYVNNYVNNRSVIHTVKPIAQPNYERIGEAATIHIQHDSKLAGLLIEQNRKIDENNDLQRATMRALQKMGVSVNMDRNGIAVSVMEVVDQISKDKRL